MLQYESAKIMHGRDFMKLHRRRKRRMNRQESLTKNYDEGDQRRFQTTMPANKLYHQRLPTLMIAVLITSATEGRYQEPKHKTIH